MKNCLLILILLVTLVQPNQSYAQVILKTDTVSVPCTFMDTVLVPVRVANFTNVGAVQFSLDWDPALLDFVTHTALNPVFSSGALFGFDTMTFIGQGNLTFVWYKNGGLTVPDNTVLFSVAFVRLGGGFAPVALADLPIEIVVGDNSPNPQPLPFQTINGGVLPIDGQPPAISCPANLTVQGNGSTVVNNIAPLNVQDNCGPPTVGWSASGSTTVNAPGDPDASGASFNPGSSQIIYTATDASGNTSTCAFTVLVESDSLVTLSIDTVLGSCQATGQQVAVDISVRGFLDIIGLQFSVEWDEAVLQFDSVGNVWPGLNLNPTNFPGADTSTADGLLRFFGGNGSTGWPDIPNDSAFFTVYFTVIDANGVSNLTFIPPFDAVNSVFNSVPVQTINGFYTSADLVPPAFTSCPADTVIAVAGNQCSAVLMPGAALAVDTCSGLAGITSNHPATNTFNVGTTTVIYTATDNAGNTSTCSRVVTVEENAGPILECPDNVAVNAAPGGTTATVNGLQPLALLDNCPGPVSLSYVRSGATTGAGAGNADGIYNAILTTVTYTATDLSGNTSTCSFTVTVDAGDPLVLLLDSVDNDCYAVGDQVAVNLTVENFIDIFGLQFSLTWDETLLQFDSVGNFFPGLDLNPTNFPGMDTSTANGLLNFFGGNGAVGYPDIPNSNIFFTLYYTILDADTPTDLLFQAPYEALTFDPVNISFNSVPIQTYNGLFSSVDQNPPVITFCPPNVTVTANGSECNVNVALPLLQATDDCSGLDNTVSSHPGSVYSVGVTTVTYTVSDVAGNTATCTTVVTVGESIPPVFTSCPTGVTGVAPDTACSTLVQWVTPNATDACSSTGLTLTSDFTQDSLFVVGSTVVTYTATDFSGNTSSCSFVVVVQDTTGPSIQCPADTTVMATGSGCTASVNLAPPTGSDNCDADLDFQSDPPAGTLFQSGVTVVTYSAADDFNNITTCTFEVTVQGSAAPQLTCPQDTIQGTVTDTCGTTVCWLEPLPVAGCDTALTLTSTHQPCDFFALGTTPVVYTVTDGSGNTATCSFDVTVTESLPPIFLNCPDVVLINLPPATCDTALTFTPPAVSDNCTLDSVTNDVPVTFPAGTTTVTYVATDASGNTAICSFDVVVIDPIAPVLSSCPPSDTITATACSATLVYTMPTASDNCDPNPEVTAQPPSGTMLPPGSVSNVLILAEDASGNYDTCIFTITVTGTTVAGFDNEPADVTVGCSAVANWTPPVAVGFCTPPVVTSNYAPGDTFPVGTTEVIYTAVDTTGVIPTQTDTLLVIILPDQGPTIACPGEPIVINAGGGVVSDPDNFLTGVNAGGNCVNVQLTFDLPLAIDSCGLQGITQTGGPLSGELFEVGLDTLLFVAVDATGNETTCPVYINVAAVEALDIVVSPNPGCAGETVTLSVATIPGAVYNWNGPQGSFPNSPTISIPSLNSAGVGLYTVSAAIGDCVLPLDSVTVQMATEPDANDDLNFTVDPNGVDSFNVLLNDILVPVSDFVITQIGNPLPGQTQLDSTGLFQYIATGQSGQASFIYQVCSRSCPDLCDMATVTITVNDRECSFIPNIFTPNGDGINDFLEIPCLDSGQYTGNSLVVYNQWGDRVYEAEPYDNDPATAWQGTLNGEAGKDLPDGVYFYIFKPAPNDPPIKGFVEIFR
jgi:gliding motility-associated-like protein